MPSEFSSVASEGDTKFLARTRDNDINIFSCICRFLYFLDHGKTYLGEFLGFRRHF